MFERRELKSRVERTVSSTAILHDESFVTTNIQESVSPVISDGSNLTNVTILAQSIVHKYYG